MSACWLEPNFPLTWLRVFPWLRVFSKDFLTSVSNITDVKYAALSQTKVTSLINYYFARLRAVSWRVWKHTWMVWRTQKVERRGKNMFHLWLFSFSVCWSWTEKKKTMMNHVAEEGLNQCCVVFSFKYSSLLLPLCSFGIHSEGWAYTEIFVCSLIILRSPCKFTHLSGKLIHYSHELQLVGNLHVNRDTFTCGNVVWRHLWKMRESCFWPVAAHLVCIISCNLHQNMLSLYSKFKSEEN